ncbi:MAG: tRNA (adenosine(37)-N6)-threonylcarbamoyltransferase complex dimerization subunit type 1 TsaB [Bacteroidales bacterium]
MGQLILHIETATDICSVALSEDGRCIAVEESGPERAHARLLSPYIRTLFEKAGKTMGDLSAVAVSKGPGSYTGLRIGVSTAKGIAYGRDIPLLSAGTLENLAFGASRRPEFLRLQEEHPDILLCPMLDARRMEVYAGIWNHRLEPVREVTAEIIDETSFRDLLESGPVCFFGNGSGKCREVLPHPNARFLEDVNPSARHMTEPVTRAWNAGDFEDVAYFEPFYLKDFVATVPRKKVL